MEVPRGQVGEGSGFAVGDDLLDDGVVAVFPLGLRASAAGLSVKKGW